MSKSQDATKNRRRLGRGLSSLINQPVAIESPEKANLGADGGPDGAAVSSDNDGRGRVVFVAVERIRPNPHQPRKTFREESLAALAGSIRSDGLMQPILLRPDGGGGYELVAGERRWRAAQLAGLTEVPAILHEIDDRRAAEWALVENLQREDLDPIERAEAFEALVDKFGLTQSQVAERVGLDRASVANLLRLNRLDETTKADVRAGRLSQGHAKALLSIEEPVARRRLAEAAILGQWSVRELERRLEGLNRPTEAAGGMKTARVKPAHVVDLEREISSALGLSVEIELRPGNKKGRVVVRFDNLKEFDRLLDRLGLNRVD